MNNNYKTSDIGLASYLKCIGLEIVSVESAHDERNPSKCVFVFADRDLALQHKDEYFIEKARVCPLTFMHNLRSLKSSIRHMNT